MSAVLHTPIWRVERGFNQRTLSPFWVVKREGEYLRTNGRFTTIRRFRTEGGAIRACAKANRAALSKATSQPSTT
jgi:hypothetical protein